MEKKQKENKYKQYKNPSLKKNGQRPKIVVILDTQALSLSLRTAVGIHNYIASLTLSRTIPLQKKITQVCFFFRKIFQANETTHQPTQGERGAEPASR